MGSLSFHCGADLRRRLRATEAEGIVHLEHGNEYQGPFILDKPISLVGHGAATQLFGKGFPAILVRSQRVRLEHLGLADSFDPERGVCLLVEEGVQPELLDVRLEGRMVTLKSDQVIDLGELLPQQQGFSFLEVEVGGPSTVRCAESSERWLWAGIGETFDKTIPAAGKYLLRVGCDARTVGAGGMALGELSLVTGSEVRTFWVAVQVLPESPATWLKGPIGLRPGKGALVRFQDGFLIGRSRFPGLAAASGMPDRQAVVRKEPDGSGWAIHQPWSTPTPILVNGVPLVLGQRRPLQEGDLLRASGLDLKVESAPATGLFLAAKSLVDLGTTAGTSPGAAVQVRYTGNGKETAKIFATVPWLRVSPPSLELKQNEVRELQVHLTLAAAALPPAKYVERGAILIQGKAETFCLDAAFEALPEFIAPRSTGSLDLGRVVEWEKAVLTVSIGNGGTKPWRPTVQVSRDWLVADQRALTVPAGRDVALSFRLNDRVLALPPTGAQTVPVRLEGDGAVLDLRISVRLDLDLTPDPRLVTAALDFQMIQDPMDATPSTVVVQNRGGSEWRAAVRAVPWLDAPTEIKVPAGKQKSFLVRVNGRLPAGRHDVADALILAGDGKSIPVAARVTYRPIPYDLQVMPAEIDLTVADDGDLSSLRTALTLSNPGRRPWKGKIESLVPWLAVTPSQGAVPVGGRLEFTVEVSEPIRGLGSGDHVFGRVLAFEGLNLGVGAKVRLRRRKPPADPRQERLGGRVGTDLSPGPFSVKPPGEGLFLGRASETGISSGAAAASGPFGIPRVETPEEAVAIEPQSLDFGQVGSWTGGPTQSLTVTVRNLSGSAVAVTLEHRADWLKVSPAERLDLPAGAAREIVVTLRPSPFQRKGRLHDPQALVLEVAGRRLRVASRVETV